MFKKINIIIRIRETYGFVHFLEANVILICLLSFTACLEKTNYYNY